jgi:spore germination protein GerM
MEGNKMAAQKKNLNGNQKRKILLVLRILLLTAAVLYLLFFLYNNYFVQNKVELYFASADANYLRVEKRTIDEESDLFIQLFEELKAGPENSELTKTIPTASRLLNYELEGKLLTLNFSLELRSNHWGGSTGEIMTVYSIVNTYTALAEVDKVRILLDGKQVETLVGHLDLTEPLMYNQKLTEDN